MGRDLVPTQGTPKMPHLQLLEHFDAAVGTIQPCMAGDRRDAGSFLHLS